MSNLTKIENEFQHELFGNLTTITNENGDVFFISNEVSSILEYSANKKLLERLDEDEKVILDFKKAKALLSGYDIHSSGIQLLTESGLYSAILGSKKEQAKAFKRWVTKEVLPTIRKTGGYQQPTTTLDWMKLAVQKEEERLLLETKTKEQEVIIQIQAPKVEFYDQVTESTDAIDVGSVAKVLNLKFGRTTLFQKLRDYKVLMHNNTPYQKYIDLGWFRIIESKWNKPDGSSHISLKTVVYQKGVDGILRLLKKS